MTHRATHSPDRPKAQPAMLPVHRSGSDAQPVTSVRFNEFGRASEDVPHTPMPGERPQDHFAQLLTRHNAPQLRRDMRDALPPVVLLFIAAFTCLTTLIAAHALYSAFFDWMTGGLL